LIIKKLMKNRMQNIHKIKILDCTLRDGGYYNNWDFSKKLAQDYINAVYDSGIRYIELGFRALKKTPIKGANWYTSESYINSLKIPKELNIGVMVNVFEITSNSLGIDKTINLLFKKSKDSRVNFVRLASHIGEIDSAFKIVKILKSKGYLVALNVMQISEQPKKKIIATGKKAQKYKPDILYFADSLGSMNEKKILDVLDSIKVHWTGEIGIHAHDNLGKALSNSLYALNKNVTWIDSTISGMGRGPGNVKTEELLLEINSIKNKNFKILPIIKILKNYFNEMKKFFQWGTNPFYYLAGKYGIHPTYIQEMLTQKLDDRDILNIINQLKEKNGSRYDVNLIRSEFQKPIKLSKGTWSPINKLKNKELLLISSGDNLKKYKKDIEDYIKLNNPIVISLKTKTFLDKKLINFYIACNPLRIMNEVKKYKSLKKPVVFPAILLTKKIRPKINGVKILDYGIGLKDNKFKFFNNCAYLPKLYTFSYALAVATSGKSAKISLAGFDGYGHKDGRTRVVKEIFSNYLKTKGSLPINFITPTIYNLNDLK